MNVEKAPLPQSSQEYLVWMIKLGQQITKKMNQLLAPFDLTFNQASILFIVEQCTAQSDGISMHELSKILDVSLANTSGLVDRLERDEFIKRTRHKSDRRTYYLELTASGKKLVEKLQTHWPPPEMKALDQFFAKLSDKERTQFTQILVAIAQQVK